MLFKVDQIAEITNFYFFTLRTELKYVCRKQQQIEGPKNLSIWRDHRREDLHQYMWSVIFRLTQEERIPNEAPMMDLSLNGTGRSWEQVYSSSPGTCPLWILGFPNPQQFFLLSSRRAKPIVTASGPRISVETQMMEPHAAHEFRLAVISFFRPRVSQSARNYGKQEAP